MIGSLRTGKTAKYLHHMGHDVRVIAADDLLVDSTQLVEIPDEHVLRTPWLRLNSPGVWLLGGRKHVQEKGYERPGAFGTLLEAVKPIYRALLHIPDPQVGWVWPAVRHTKPWLGSWRPDVIIASSLPLSSAWAAAAISKQLGVPWVSELRDLAGMDREPADSWMALRRPLDSWMFDVVMKSAAGFVTVSPRMCRWLERRFPGIPVECVYNGFDLEDFPTDVEVPFRNGELHLTHTGSMYAGLRDPRPLFKALRILGDEREHIRVHFYGRYTQTAADTAREEGVESSVVVHGSIPYKESLQAQMSSDVLLLLMVNKPSLDGSYSGKFFEYLATRRPILALARDQNAAGTLIRERNAGFASLEPEAIAEQLRAWLAQKRTSGSIPALSPGLASEFSREEQTRIFERFLHTLPLTQDSP